MRIIAITNIAGGVAKTTTAVNLGHAIGQTGKRVLIVDLDAQANSTTYIGTESKRFIAEALDDPRLFPETIGPTKSLGVDLAHGSLDTAGVEMILAQQPASAATRLRKALRTIADRYDYVFIDAPPAPGILTINAIVAADEIVIPVETKPKALEGVGNMRALLSQIVDDPDLMPQGRPVGRYLATRYDGRTVLDRKCLEDLRANDTFSTFATVIRVNQKIPESYALQMSVIEYDPSSNGAADYIALSTEFLRNGN
jgi:chromosome partitioning protein